MTREERNRIEGEIRVHSVGFYDGDGVWFFLWERSRPHERYSYELASRRWGGPMVRFFVDGYGPGEMLVADFMIHGLPHGEDDDHARAFRALHDAAAAADGDLADRAARALEWYERRLSAVE